MIHDTLQAEGKPLPLVSVIIPVYNTERYIRGCLESVLAQTYPNIEILCTDDGSTDQSPDLIQQMMQTDGRIHLVRGENRGQGYARNRAMERAAGEYILFLDSDDCIEPQTLDLAVTRAEREQSDFVVFDWYYYNTKTGKPNYSNQDCFFSKPRLVGQECLELFRIAPLFTVNKLYRRQFLKDHGIVFGEGYLYEDHPFWYAAVLNAENVSLIHAPLYRVTVNPTSSTRMDRETDRHAVSFAAAMAGCLDLLDTYAYRLTDPIRYHIAYYFFQKFLTYYTSRTPAKHRKSFFQRFCVLICSFQFSDQKENRFLTACLKYRIFARQRYIAFHLLAQLRVYVKPRLQRFQRKAKNRLKQTYAAINRRLGLPYRQELTKNRQLLREYRLCRENSLPDPNIILFLGFDYRYTGNSRYLFEQLQQRAPAEKKIYFASQDSRVVAASRLEPDSEAFYAVLARAGIVIAETWIPLRYVKRRDAVWIQLWHGTPLKRMLYDSHERQITSRQPGHKRAKFKDIQRWDYLIADSPHVASYFQTCFGMQRSKIICSGYPRVRYLVENRGRKDIIAGLRAQYDIEDGRTIVAYLPTWRDYNYHVPEEDFNLEYLLDLKALQQELGDGYELIYKDHVYLSRPQNVDFKNYADAETQEILLMADYLVTDYSSVLFDAMAIGLPTALYCLDIEQNEDARGLYPGMWRDLEHLNCKTVAELAQRIRSGVQPGEPQDLAEKYAFLPAEEQRLWDLLIDDPPGDKP